MRLVSLRNGLQFSVLFVQKYGSKTDRMTTGQVDANRISLVKSMADETEEDIGLDACRIE